MFQDSEVVSLALAIIFVVAIACLHRVMRLPRLPRIYAGAFFLVCANVFTVAEGVVWYGLFNTLEHLCYAAAGVSFALGCWLLPSTLRQQEPADQ